MAEKPKKAAVPAKKTAPTLYIIAGFKIFKGVLLLIFAVTLFAMAKQDLPEIFDKIVSWFHLDPENKFFSSVSVPEQQPMTDRTKMTSRADGNGK
jgi:hypothetical protein